VALINAVRFTLKSLGYPVSNPSSQRFHKLVLKEVPESIREMIVHNVAAIAELTERIKALDTSISRLAAECYPETIYLQQVSGVGPITSLYFVLKVGNPGRFQRTRDIGGFLGLSAKRDQSGETDKELRISKCGDPASLSRADLLHERLRKSRLSVLFPEMIYERYSRIPGR
jgi:transposase